MKQFLQLIQSNPTYIKIIEWGRVISITGLVQIIIQILGFISGILIIRLLPTQEYALYTLANTMLGTMTLLADGGISTGVLSIGGKVWNDPKKLGKVIVTGLDLRKKFSVISLVIGMPVLVYLLMRHGASLEMSVLIVISLIALFLSALFGNLLEIPSKLRQDILPLQKNQILSNVGRATLVSITAFIFPFAFVAFAATSIPQIWYNRRLKKISQLYADRSETLNADTRKEILSFVKRLLPGAIYFCLSGQITIWIISIIGKTADLAKIGALGRLAMILNIFTVLFATIITPRFARLQNDQRLILNRYIQIQIGMFFLSVFIVSMVKAFPSEALWILGSSYSNFGSEFILIIVGSCLNFISASTFALCTSRGWILHPLISISVEIASIVLGCVLTNFSSLQDILMFNIIFVSGTQVIMYSLYGLKKILVFK